MVGSGHQPFALSGWELGMVSVGLVCAAMLAPLPLYLVALTLFGLPHVLWELHWIRQTYRLHIPNGMWLAWWGILGIQASSATGRLRTQAICQRLASSMTSGTSTASVIPSAAVCVRLMLRNYLQALRENFLYCPNRGVCPFRGFAGRLATQQQAHLRA